MLKCTTVPNRVFKQMSVDFVFYSPYRKFREIKLDILYNDKKINK